MSIPSSKAAGSLAQRKCPSSVSRDPWGQRLHFDVVLTDGCFPTKNVISKNHDHFMIYKYQSLKNHVFFSKKKKYVFKHLTLPP